MRSVQNVQSRTQFEASRLGFFKCELEIKALHREVELVGDSHEGDSLVRPGYGDLMPKKEVIQANLAAGNPNLSPALPMRNAKTVFVARDRVGRLPCSWFVPNDWDKRESINLQRLAAVQSSKTEVRRRHRRDGEFYDRCRCFRSPPLSLSRQFLSASGLFAA
jgi:hypothetical protein